MVFGETKPNRTHRSQAKANNNKRIRRLAEKNIQVQFTLGHAKETHLVVDAVGEPIGYEPHHLPPLQIPRADNLNQPRLLRGREAQQGHRHLQTENAGGRGWRGGKRMSATSRGRRGAAYVFVRASRWGKSPCLSKGFARGGGSFKWRDRGMCRDGEVEERGRHKKHAKTTALYLALWSCALRSADATPRSTVKPQERELTAGP